VERRDSLARVGSLMAEPSGPSIGELLGNLARDTGTLVRQEIQLASAEMQVKARKVARNAGLIAVGGALTLAGGLALLIAAIAGLALVIPLWLAALILGVVICGGGYAFVRVGLRGLREIQMRPEQTIQTLNADVAWAKEQVR